MQIIAFQTELRPALPNVYGTVEYEEFRGQLEHLDRILKVSGLENDLVGAQLQVWEHAAKNVTSKRREKKLMELRYALRCNIARHLIGEPFRVFGIRLADSELLRWFTGIHGFESRKAISKSALERYDKLFPVEVVEQAVRDLTAKILETKGSRQILGQTTPLNLDAVFADCTCVEANIHFPVDWLLLHDAVHSLIKAIRTIRRQGLKHRMPRPETFIKQINNLCIKMTHEYYKKDSKKKRKRILRDMKLLAKTVRSHAERYHAVLTDNWEQTAWSYKQTQVVLKRIDHILERLPEAIHQAHERIIGERRVPNTRKMLSLHDDDIHVIVRGKASAATEFGNGLYLAEQRDGLIVDWQLFKDRPPADTRLVDDSLTRMEQAYGSIGAFCTDRGFDSQLNRELLEAHDVYNAMCPRDPVGLRRRAKEPRFLKLQGRRAQTEGRIGIFKNVFLDSPIRSKGFEYKRNTVAWCVLTHNLWVLARLALANERQRAAA